MPNLNVTKFLPVLLILFFSCLSANIFASTLTVTNGNDTGSGSLRNAITSSVAGDVIVFSGVTTVSLTSNELLIDKNLTINGGAGVTVTRSGGTLFRIFLITAGTVTLNNLTISNGNKNFGAGIYASTGTSVTLNTCIITGNQSTQGGGIQNNGSMTLTNCAVTNNSASTEGGGIAAYGPSITLIGCTVSGNSAANYSGLVISATGIAFSMTNCTISSNLGVGIIYNNIGSTPTATLTNCTITNHVFGMALQEG
ncbi:MAG: right-handed parallel beta-helix repeat-containing protein, partial [Saprospiraceae bacterium]